MKALYSAAEKIHMQVAAVPFKATHLESYLLSLMTVALFQKYFGRQLSELSGEHSLNYLKSGQKHHAEHI